MGFRILKIIYQANKEIQSFLADNIIGTPGQSAVYQQLNTHEKLKQLPNPHFACLQREKLLGLCCFCQRSFYLNGEEIVSFYVRYFSFKDAFRSQKSHSRSQNKRNAIKNEVHQLLEGHELLKRSTPNIFYAFVDPNNERSAVLCNEFGFQTIRTFKTYSLGYLFPRKRIAFEKIASASKAELSELLRNFYSDYTFYTEDNLFYRDQYFMVRDENGKVLVGIQANPENWKIHDLPGWSGKMLLHVASKLPITNRLIRPNYQFLALDYLYCQPGQEETLSQLIESLLAHFSLSTAMVLADAESSLHQTLKRIDHGIVGKIKKPVSISVIAKGNQFSDYQWNHIKNSPSFQSSFDTT
ncbi:hypothetical protein [Reichenbachiella ulvae]|uniref:Acetyltransferase (GNAT) domain-containing protein n=1 Tax=Reichenbachiella ulvae TaxID=2980104 RepID=A0ABT3CTT2_9BACT|nr:hypothetical protein [Reichenbachiella ulvae]MCV9387029.1 hypothetical protein [Reichenbachiella ulvae]